MQTKTAQKKQINVLPIGQALLMNGFVDVIKHYSVESIRNKHRFCSDGYHNAEKVNTKHYSIFLRMSNKQNTAKNSTLFFNQVNYNSWHINNYYKPIPEKPLSEIVKAHKCGVSYNNMYVVEISVRKAKKIRKLKDPLVYTNIDGKILKIAFWS